MEVTLNGHDRVAIPSVLSMVVIKATRSLRPPSRWTMESIRTIGRFPWITCSASSRLITHQTLSFCRSRNFSLPLPYHPVTAGTATSCNCREPKTNATCTHAAIQILAAPPQEIPSAATKILLAADRNAQLDIT